MIFNADMLLEENYNIPTQLQTSNVNESYFSMALEFVNEISNDFSSANKTFYREILEAGENYEVVQESFSGFCDKVKEIIEKFLKFLKNIWTKFIISMNKLVKSDKYLTKHKADFDKFTSEHEFDMKIYKYTKLDDDNFPKVEAYKTYDSLTADYKLAVGNDTITSDFLYNRLSDTYNSILDDLPEWYNKFRGEVLGEPDQSFTSKEFEEELHRKFRNDEDSPSKETITYMHVREAYDRFDGYEKAFKHVEDLKKKLEKQYKEIKNSIKDLPTDNVNGSEILSKIYSDYNVGGGMDAAMQNAYKSTDKKKDINAKLDAINKTRINRIESMCKIHSLAFTSKLDAMKEAYKQDKKLLYVALKKVNPIKVKTESLDLTLDTEDNNRYSQILEYANFVIQESQNQNDIIRYIGECVALEDGNLSAIEAMNESAIDVIKNIISKIVAAVKEMFGRFTTNMSSLFTTNKTFLEKYKDVILKKPFKDRDVTMYNYDIKKIDKYTIPRFDDSVFKWIDSGEKTDEELKELFISTFSSTNLNGMKAEGGDIKDKIIDAIRGEDQVEMKLQGLNKEEMYNYCIHYDNTVNQLNKDINTNTSNQNAINSALSKKSAELERLSREANQESVYSSVYDTFLNEGDSAKISKENKNSSSSSGSANSTTGSAVKSSMGSDNVINADTAKTAVGIVSNKYNDAVQNKENGKNNLEQAKKSIEQYRNVAKIFFESSSEILAAKMQVCEAIYKDYIKILRVHVKDYGGSADGDKFTDREGKDYSQTQFTIESNDDENKHTFSYNPNVKLANITTSISVKDINISLRNKKLLGNKEKSNDILQKYSNAMFEASKKILGKSPTLDHIFEFDGKYCVYSGQDNTWKFCDVTQKVGEKIKDAVKNVTNNG